MATMTAATSKVTRDETRRAVNDVNNRHKDLSTHENPEEKNLVKSNHTISNFIAM